MDIRCKKCDCKHNKNCACWANKIKVGASVDCETYEFSEEKSIKNKENLQKNLFEISSEKAHVMKNTKIYCDASCLFNNCGVCNANGISVLESDYGSKTPICATQIDE